MNLPWLPQPRGIARSLAAALAVAALTACGTQTSTQPSAASGAKRAVSVIAAFYPLEYVATRIGGTRVAVTNLSKPGVEPHDLELTPKDRVALSKAAVVLRLKGFQTAVDDALAAGGSAVDIDAGQSAHLDVTTGSSGAADPHFWLDPTKLAAVGRSLADELSALDPTAAPTYAANLDALSADLTTLDREFEQALATCASRDLVTGHAAFGYLANRYHLTQLPISGLSPDQEPNAARMVEIIGQIRSRGVTTVYAETLVSPKLSEAIATQTGATVAVLDPIEGLGGGTADGDYLSLMRANLSVLRTGQGCT